MTASRPSRTLALIGDVHAAFAALEQVVAAIPRYVELPLDGVLLVGDLGKGLGRDRPITAERRAAYLDRVDRVLSLAATLKAPVRYVPGNHDLPDLDLAGNVDRRCEALTPDLRVAGIGGAGPQRVGLSYEWDEAEIEARTIDPSADVLLAHCPPKSTPLDRMWRGRHVGSTAIRAHVEAHRGLFVCGHIHEAPGIIQIERGV